MQNAKYLYIFLHLPKTGGTTINIHLSRQLKMDEQYVHLGKWGDDYWKKHQLQNWRQRTQEQKNRALFIAGHNTYYGVHTFVTSRQPRYIIIVRNPFDRFVSGYHYDMSAKAENQIIDILTYYDLACPDAEGLGLYLRRNEVCRYLCKMNRWQITRQLIQKHWFKTLARRFRKMMDVFLPKSMHKLYLELSYWLWYRSAKNLLNKCWFIGVTNSLDNTLPFLFSEMGVNTKYEKFRVNEAGKNIDSKEELLDERTLKKFPITEQQLQQLKIRYHNENKYDIKLFEYAQKRGEELLKKHGYISGTANSHS